MNVEKMRNILKKIHGIQFNDQNFLSTFYSSNNISFIKSLKEYESSMGTLFITGFWINFSMITLGYGEFLTDKTFLITRDVTDSFVSASYGSTKTLCDQYLGAKMTNKGRCRCAAQGALTTTLPPGEGRTLISEDSKEMGCFDSATHIGKGSSER